MTDVAERQTLSQRATEDLATRMMGLFEAIIQQRKAQYQSNPETRPSLDMLSKIKTDAAGMNALISGAANLVPGPWGFLTIVPEIYKVTRNQLDMICDIAAAHGKQDMLTKELLAGVFASAMGTSLGSLMMMHGGKVLVKRSSLQVFQKVVTALAGSVTQRALKATIGKFLPFIGAAALAAWSYHSTRMIADQAIRIFEQEIQFDTSEVSTMAAAGLAEVDNIPIPIVTSKTVFNGYSKEVEIEKVHLMINMMRADSVVDSEEMSFILKTIHALADGHGFTSAERNRLIDLAYEGHLVPVDYSCLRDLGDQGIDVMTTLVFLAKKDGEFHQTERDQVQYIAHLIDFPKNELERLLA